MDTVIRPATPTDRPAVLAMANRLEEGVAPWRDLTAVAGAVEGWVADSLDQLDQTGRAMFVALLAGEIIGWFALGILEALYLGFEEESYGNRVDDIEEADYASVYA